MSFKFAVGQAVEYRPANGPIRVCTIIRQMPAEDGQFAFRYRIKNDKESFERNVFEYDLTAYSSGEAPTVRSLAVAAKAH